MAPKKRQPKAKGDYCKVHPQMEVEDWLYVRDYDRNKTFAANLTKIVQDHRRKFCNSTPT